MNKKKKVKGKLEEEYCPLRAAITQIWCIIVLVLIALVFHGISYLNQEEIHFRITEEVCWDESDWYAKVYCPEIHFSTTGGLDVADKIIELCNITSYESQSQVCKQFEVGEIELYCEEKCINKQSWNEAESCLKNNGCDTFFTKILKQDLSLKWLDENCEWTKNIPCEDIECKKGGYATEYKCGNYQVEVWNQIK